MAEEKNQKLVRTPPTKSYRDLPLSPVSYWDTVPMVRKALDELERGMFRSAAHLADAMLRDDRISGVLSTRVNGLLSQPIEFEPPSGEDAPKAELALAEQVEKAWPRIAPDADLEDLFKWGVLLNCGPGELVWNTSDKEWTPRIRNWHPSQVYWRWDTRSYWLNTMEGPVELPNPLDGKRDAKWVLYTPYGYERGWMRGAIRALALPWLIRGFVRRDWAHHSEVAGQGIKVGSVPISVDVEERQKFIQSLANLGAAGVLEAPTLPNGEKFDLKLVESTANTWEGFLRLLEHADTAIAIVILGQNLTTEVQEGSRAAAQVHDSVRKDFQGADNRKFGGTLRQQVLRPYALYNAGDEELAPTPAWQTDPPEDLKDRGAALTALGTFLTAAKNAGAPVDQRALLDEFGVQAITPEEEAKQKQEAEERAAQAQPADPAEEPTEPQLHTARETLPRGARRGQAYVDALTAKAVDHSAHLLEVDLKDLVEQVHAATSPADLRHRLVHLYRGMDVKRLSLLVERAELLAELAGRKSVLEDVV